MKNQALAVTLDEKERAIEIAAIPDYLKQHVGSNAGNENVGQDDLLIPRLSIAQTGMSAQLKKSSDKYIPGLQPGELFNTVTNEIYGTKVRVVPILFFKNFIDFVPIKEGGGVRAMYNGIGEVPKGMLDFKDGNPPQVTEFKNRLSLIIRDGHKPELVVASFKSSGLKTAKKWNQLIASTNMPAYARSYVLEVKTKTKGEQEWFILDVMPDVFVPQAFFNEAKAYFDNLSQGGYKVDTSGLDDEVVADTEFPTIDAEPANSSY